MKPRNVEDVYPLAPLQEGLLFHALSRPRPGIDHEQIEWTLAGDLEPALMAAAWRALMARHAILRTAFYWQEIERPVQVVRSDAELPWRVLDWRSLDAGERRRRFAELAREERLRPFDLARAPMMRLVLVRLGECRHRCLWSYHHLLLDGWSVALVMEELFALYEALARGAEPELPPPRPYRDYLAWLAGRDTGDDERFWRRWLDGVAAPTPLGLPAPVGERDGEPDGEPDAELRLPLGEAETAAVRAAARRLRVSLNTVVQGAWALLLAADSGEREPVFGTIVAGRPADLPGAESIVGLFVNALPMRVRVEPRRPLAEWLQALQRAQAAMREHEHTPLVAVQGWSAVPRGLPLFDSLFVFENQPARRLAGERSGRLEVTAARHRYSSNGYPLTVGAEPRRRLTLVAMHDRDRLDGPAVRRLLVRLRALLAAVAASEAERPVGDLPALPAAERHRLLVEYNDTAGGDRGEIRVEALIAARTAATPDAVAVSWEGGALSYGELLRRARRLSRRLRRLGVAGEARVGVLLERSPELMVALVGVLASGAAYVPLDPAYPAERLRFMLADARVGVLLTRQRWAPLGADAGGARVLCAGPGWEGEEEEEEEESLERAAGDVRGLAYVIYTSGSSGRPKGVMVSHDALVRTLEWRRRHYRLGPGDVVPQGVALSFDPSLWELLGPLAAGARLVLPAPGAELDPGRFAALLAREGVTVTQRPPSMLPELAASGGLAACRALRQVICGGEALPPAVRDRFFAATGAGLDNLYGPAEGGLDVTAWRCRRDAAAGPVPIGRPIADKRVYQLDHARRPVAAGVVGEIAVGGPGLARGYLGRPALTAERFLPDPFTSEPGARMYATGDLGRWLDAGDLLFTGRADRQVKVRGFRVEPEEVEAALTGHPGVREAAVVVHGEGAERRLVAYLTAGDGVPPAAVLRTHLRALLPPPMVPGAFVALPALPRTPGGKLDRGALPAPAPALAETVFVAPESELERRIAAVWERVLAVERVGLHDNFFDLGGHSLLLLRVHRELRGEIPRGLSIVDLYDHPTVAALAAVAAGGDGGGEPAAAPRRGRDRASLRRGLRRRRPPRPRAGEG